MLRGLKLIKQVMKVIERVVEELIRQRVEIDKMQCSFMLGRGTIETIFIVLTSHSTWPLLTWRKHLIMFPWM